VSSADLPGSPWEIGCNERFSGTLRHEILNAKWFHSIKQARGGLGVEALIDSLCEGDILLAEKGCDSNAIRAKAAERKASANIPLKANHKDSFTFCPWVYRQRNLVERFFNRIKQFRVAATRYDKRPENYPAAVKLIAARLWCQSLSVYSLDKVPYAYDTVLYCKRHKTEKLFAKFKDLAVHRNPLRPMRPPHTFFSAICIAALVILRI